MIYLIRGSLVVAMFVGAINVVEACEGLIRPEALKAVGMELTTSDVDELYRLSQAHGSSSAGGMNVGYAGFSLGMSSSDASTDQKDELKKNKRSDTHFVLSSAPVVEMARAYLQCRQLEAGKESLHVEPTLNGLASLDVGLSTSSDTDAVQLVGVNVRPVGRYGGLDSDGASSVTCKMSELGKKEDQTLSNVPGVDITVGAKDNGPNRSRVLRCDRLPISTTTGSTQMARYLPVTVELEFATHDKFQFSLPWPGGGVPPLETLEGLQAKIAALEATVASNAGRVDLVSIVDTSYDGAQDVLKYLGANKPIDVLINIPDEQSLLEAEAGVSTHGWNESKVFKFFSMSWTLDGAERPCSENTTSVDADGRAIMSLTSRCAVILNKGVHHLQLTTRLGTSPNVTAALKEMSGFVRVRTFPLRAVTAQGSAGSK